MADRGTAVDRGGRRDEARARAEATPPADFQAADDATQTARIAG